jgi:CheY-like chemotaxis protein/anti-sigma regulatory factor (Ser/Thr protein kinase)
MAYTPKILIVDDEELNVEILNEYLQEEGYLTKSTYDGLEALSYLREHQDIDVILLDRMMPMMDGITLIRTLREEKVAVDTPIIVQTAAAETQEIIEGIKAGAFYYLTKPYGKDILISIVRSAVHQAIQRRSFASEVQRTQLVPGLLTRADFSFRTSEEAKRIALLLSRCYPDSERVYLGLNALFVNAIEHGNLDIGYDEKTKLVRAGVFELEVAKRLQMPQNQEKKVHVSFAFADGALVTTIKDEGRGFDASPYLHFDPMRATDPNGRGIAMANMTSFDTIDFINGGNTVVCRVKV